MYICIQFQTQVQILNKAIWISNRANILEKIRHQTSLFPSISKYWNRIGYLILVGATNQEKEHSEFKSIKRRLKIDFARLKGVVNIYIYIYIYI